MNQVDTHVDVQVDVPLVVENIETQMVLSDKAENLCVYNLTSGVELLAQLRDINRRAAASAT